LKLRKLSLRHFRNVQELSFDCEDGIHFIYGQNAQGKTSILEAISLLSHLKSFREAEPQDLLGEGHSFSSVKGSFNIEDTVEAELKVELVKGLSRVEKRAYINQKMTRSTAEYWGLKSNHSTVQFHAISLNPTSTDLLRRDPAYRRSYLNQAISSEHTEHLPVLKRYQKTVDQKKRPLEIGTGSRSSIASNFKRIFGS